ncbi:hypothetical protein JMJ35_000396 [Cladonia borealis]|uniref:non-specific serine/threonine protein kinase n=1 Tax=Cladonia borealis TaxID=184061 RepID=A0AA39UF50_9LECA|nr:hypothetical protein JMJ35_000396 [Cladonia borealis]
MVAEPPLLLLIAIARAKKPKAQAGMPLGIWRHTKVPHAFEYRGRLLAAYYHIYHNVSATLKTSEVHSPNTSYVFDECNSINAAHYIETAVDEIKLLNKIVAANPNHPGRKHVVSLLDSFEHKGPNGVHVCMVFVAVFPCQRRGTSNGPESKSIQYCTKSSVKSLTSLFSATAISKPIVNNLVERPRL